MPDGTSTSCPVCEAHETRLFDRLDVGLAAPSQVRCCDACGCAFFRPFPQPDHGGGSPVLDKFALEYATGIGCMLEALLPVRGLPAERILEIGGGYGFLLDAAGLWCGARELCMIEPAPVAGVLEHPVIAGYFPADLPPGQFDLILASEVLEHVPAPLDFLAAIFARLTAGGLAILTTPNGGVLREEDPPHRAGMLSPGQHMVLFSPQALEKTVRSLGGVCRIDARGAGRTGRNGLVCVLAREARVLERVGPLPSASSLRTRGAIAAYYRAKLVAPPAETPAQRWLRAGLLARLAELEVSIDDRRAGATIAELERGLEQDYGLDEAAQWALPDALEACVGQDLHELIPRYPCFLGRVSYFRAMWRLNHAGDPVGAARLFSLSLRLLMLEQRGFSHWFAGNRSLVAQAARHTLIATRRSIESRVLANWLGLAQLGRELARPAGQQAWRWLRGKLP